MQKSDLFNIIDKYKGSNPRGSICLVGPTASGKTSLALDIASRYDGELINADSKQVYSGIESITGLDYDEIKNVDHYLFGTNDPAEVFSLSDFLHQVRAYTDEILSRNNTPIIVGGTGLFITALQDGYQLPDYEDINLDTYSNKQLIEKLAELDPDNNYDEYSNNRRRLERALKVAACGTSIKANNTNDDLRIDCLVIYIDFDEYELRKVLYDKINTRQRFLFDSSVDVIWDVIKKYHKFPDHLPAFTSIGIKEIWDHKKGNISREDAILSMQKRARNYAKRQMTWWRNKKGLIKIYST